MRYLILSSVAALGLVLAGCSDGEGPAPGFTGNQNNAGALGNFVVNQCQRSPEGEFPALFAGTETFGSNANTETGLPENSTFTANCL